MTKLRAVFRRDDDGSGMLSVEVSDPPFAGASHAWFGAEYLVEFADRLAETYPLSAADPMHLAGGFWDSAGSVLRTVHVGLTFYPFGSRGVVGCRVRLATPVPIEEERERRLDLDLRCSYAGVREFARGLSAVARGEAEEAVLECAEV